MHCFVPTPPRLRAPELLWLSISMRYSPFILPFFFRATLKPFIYFDSFSINFKSFRISNTGHVHKIILREHVWWIPIFSSPTPPGDRENGSINLPAMAIAKYSTFESENWISSAAHGRDFRVEENYSPVTNWRRIRIKKTNFRGTGELKKKNRYGQLWASNLFNDTSHIGNEFDEITQWKNEKLGSC